MPKLKTRRGAAKRFSITAKGKVKRRRGFLRHILTSKTSKQKRHLRRRTLVDGRRATAVLGFRPRRSLEEALRGH